MYDWHLNKVYYYCYIYHHYFEINISVESKIARTRKGNKHWFEKYGLQEIIGKTVVSNWVKQILLMKILPSSPDSDNLPIPLPLTRVRIVANSNLWSLTEWSLFFDCQPIKFEQMSRLLIQSPYSLVLNKRKGGFVDNIVHE